MKRFTAVLTAAAMLFSAAACGSNDSTEQTTAVDTPSPTSTDEQSVTTTAAADTSPSTTADEPPVTTTTAAESSEETDLSALELIGYQIDEDGEIWINEDQWQECEDFDLFRKYFFGIWDGEAAFGERFPLYVVDDSEKAFLMNDANWRFTGFYRVSENVLAFEINGQAGLELFWLDINDPDRMYAQWLVGNINGLLHAGNDEKFETPVLTKTDTPPNEPEENFLSIYKLLEMSREYGIDLELLIDIEREANIEYEGKEITTLLRHDDWYQFFPVYLVSEAPDRLELKTRVGNLVFKNLEIGVRYTLEKVDGEWVRTVEYDDEALTALSVIRYQIDDRWIVRFDADRWEYSEDYDLFRKYFFGTWEYAEKKGNASFFVIDDSEKTTIQTPWSFGGFYEIDENVLAFTMWASAEGSLCWLDRNEPGRMYAVDCAPMQIHQYAWFNDGIAVLTKTDTPPNEPENNYLSDIRLRELSRKYGIDILEMIYIHCETDREEDGKKTTVHMDADIYPKYLISEAPEKVVLKMRVGNPYEKVAIDAWCTFEKVDGEWVRTVEFDGEVRLR